MTQTPNPDPTPTTSTTTPPTPTTTETTPPPLTVPRLMFRRPLPNTEDPAAAGRAEPLPPPASNDTPPAPKPTKSGSSQASSLADFELEKQLREGIEGIVYTVTGQAHELLSRDAYAEAAGVWLADEQDAQGISAPASRIIGRRTGDVMGAGNPDIADGFMVGIAGAFYVVKQLGRFLAAKRARRAGAVIPTMPMPSGPAGDAA